ncbi:hypothetical protein FM119_03960 [Mycetocola reblochoni REB411]|uniref:Uncharacterized protein n=1 Tax=Mycetocola reblochoni REB411 TaxID=1255698 RepID=A0A1R4IWE9_9MICO|nr:hypothetical protein FM119_03960 [Mycetocola reblochoni REB411]
MPEHPDCQTRGHLRVNRPNGRYCLRCNARLLSYTEWLANQPQPLDLKEATA